MTSSGNNFNDFPEIVPTREVTTKIEKSFFLVRGRGPVSWVHGPNAAASIAPTLIRHWLCAFVASPVSVRVMLLRRYEPPFVKLYCIETSWRRATKPSVPNCQPPRSKCTEWEKKTYRKRSTKSAHLKLRPYGAIQICLLLLLLLLSSSSSSSSSQSCRKEN